MVQPRQAKHKILTRVPHLPFQEFRVPSLEGLIGLLRKAKIADSEIEVSSSEEGQHSSCSKPLVHVMIMTAGNVAGGEYRDLKALYQYCPGCGNAVRIL